MTHFDKILSSCLTLDFKLRKNIFEIHLIDNVTKNVKSDILEILIEVYHDLFETYNENMLYFFFNLNHKCKVTTKFLPFREP